jgi:hypothetical protein
MLGATIAFAVACGSSEDNGGPANGTSSAGGQSNIDATGIGSSSSTGGASATRTGTGGSTATTIANAAGEKFSFFVTSYKSMKTLAGTDDGFGGDLRYGTATGLTGADKICSEIAETSMPGNGKQWRAYLSTSTVNAIDRIGEGPWYDRRGRLFAAAKADLLATRPIGADSTIVNDFPNEDGTPNHAPDGTQVDNHDVLTGTNHLGALYSATAHCSDWTSSAADNSKKPRVGHAWPRSDTGSRVMPGGTTAGSNMPGMAHWASALDEAGCGAGVNLIETGAPGRDGVVGSGGGYGGIYCFALTP